MDTAQMRQYVVEAEHPRDGWQEMFRSDDDAEARRFWEHLQATGIAARARLIEVVVLRSFDPTPSAA